MKNKDDYYIKRCMVLGEQAAASGNPPVGCVLVLNDVIISEAQEAAKSKMDITCHAELEAIRMAVKTLNTNNLSDAVLYTTHEPCVMCAYAIRFHRIKKVIFLHTVSFLGGVSSALPLLTTTAVPPHWGVAPEIVHYQGE